MPRIGSIASSHSDTAQSSAIELAQQQQQQQQQQNQQSNPEAEDEKPQELEEEENDDEVQKVYFQSDFEDLPYTPSSSFARSLTSAHTSIESALSLALPKLKLLLGGAMLVAFAVYFGFAMWCEQLSSDGSVRLLTVTSLVIAIVLLRFVLRSERFLNNCLVPVQMQLQHLQQKHQSVISIVGTIAFFAYFVGFVIGMGLQDSRNLVSGLGVVTIVVLAVLLSAHPTRVNWRPVMGGLTLQITLAALLLRTEPGFQTFKYLADRVAEFIEHVDAGCEFVFGESFRDHFFAFSVLPVIIFFSSFIALMFHFGILQSIISALGSIMQSVMGTTAGESLVAAANIFIGQSEAPLLIRPFVGLLTNSELHAVITSGYATIAGGVLAAYIGLGVPPQDLLSASVMVAPGALALSKIMYPETKKSKTGGHEIGQINMGKYHNAIDAIATGAIDAIGIAAAIAANLISFITMLTFVNKTLTWFGDRVCLGVELTFELICSYVLWPIAFAIGIDSIDCANVAELIGTKFFINEFVAYNRFNTFRENRLKFLEINRTDYIYNRTHLWYPGTNETLTGGILFESRSLTLVTYALCGFANISSIGMQLGVFCVMMPSRKSEIVPIVLRGVITGTMANLMTASVAGIFYQSGM